MATCLCGGPAQQRGKIARARACARCLSVRAAVAGRTQGAAKPTAISPAAAATPLFRRRVATRRSLRIPLTNQSRFSSPCGLKSAYALCVRGGGPQRWRSRERCLRRRFRLLARPRRAVRRRRVCPAALPPAARPIWGIYFDSSDLHFAHVFSFAQNSHTGNVASHVRGKRGDEQKNKVAGSSRPMRFTPCRFRPLGPVLSG